MGESSKSNEPTEPLTLNSLDREYIFLSFAFVECGRAKRALGDVFRLADIREIDVECGIERREWISIFDAIRMGLHFAGSVSRIFFPPKNVGAAKLRGERLRQLTGISENHPIRDRALRNHVEHLDERMDVWTETSPRPFAGAIEMTIDEDMFQITRNAIEATCPFIYYSQTRQVLAFGDTFDLPLIEKALTDVSKRLADGMDRYRDEKRGKEFETPGSG